MEKYGFIYIWYDCKRKMYYIGSHYGTEDDGYICSSNRMRDAYRRRSHDFKRRIIKNKIDRSNLLEEEHKWLQLIPDDELGKKYYNLRKHKWGHWSTDEKTKLSIKEKIIKKLNNETIYDNNMFSKFDGNCTNIEYQLGLSGDYVSICEELAIAVYNSLRIKISEKRF